MIAFLIKRAAVCVLLIFCVLAAAGKPDIYLVVGLLAGSLLSICKSVLFWILPLWLIKKPAGDLRAIFIGLASPLISLAVLLVAVNINQQLFFGLAAGMLNTVAVICVNAVTEKLGITHNQWGNM